MKKNYYTPQLRFHKLRFNAAIQAASGGESPARISMGGSNGFDGGPFEMDAKGYSSFYYDEDEEY